MEHNLERQLDSFGQIWRAPFHQPSLLKVIHLPELLYIRIWKGSWCTNEGKVAQHMWHAWDPLGKPTPRSASYTDQYTLTKQGDFIPAGLCRTNLWEQHPVQKQFNAIKASLTYRLPLFWINLQTKYTTESMLLRRPKDSMWQWIWT